MNVWSFRKNHAGKLALGNEDRYIPNEIKEFKAKQVSCGDYRKVLIDLDNNIWTWILKIINIEIYQANF